MKTIKTKINNYRKWVILCVLVITISACIGVYKVFAADGDVLSVQVVVYGRKEDEKNFIKNATTSQLMEVRTNGFDRAAYFEYSYGNRMVTEYRNNAFVAHWKATANNWLYVFDHNRSYEYNQSDTSRQVHNRDWKDFNSKFFAWRYGEWGVGSITVYATDINPNSQTYGRSVKTSIYGLPPPDLAKDMNKGIGAMVKGETMEIRELLATGGMPKFSNSGLYNPESDIFKFEPIIEDGISIQKEDNVSNYKITGTESGLQKIRVGEKRNVLGDSFYNSVPGTFRWDYGDPVGEYEFYVFEKEPIITPEHKTIKLTNTTAGITYTCGYESFTPKEDDEEIVFGIRDYNQEEFLMPGKEYLVEMIKDVDGKKARYMMQTTTKGTSYINYDFNGVEPNENFPKTEEVAYDSVNLADKLISAKGYEFNGWNSKPDGSGIDYSTTIVDQEQVTVYAQWEKCYYDAEIVIKKDGQDYIDATVGLYQNGKQIYALQQDPLSQTYKNNNVEFSKYAPDDGAYDIYINGVDSENDFIITGDEPNGTELSQSLYCFMAKINLTNNGSPWTDQKVVFNKDNKEYATTYNTSTNQYEHMFIYKDEIPREGPYYAYVNNTLIKNGNDIQKLIMTDVIDKNILNIPFYSASVDIKKDDIPWDGATVTLRQKGTIIKTLSYNLTSSKYEIDGLIDFNQQYDVYVEGTNSSEQVNKTIDVSSKEVALEYYTVSYKDINKVYNTQIILSGDVARKPSSPVMEGNTFSYWATKEDDSGDKYFQNGETTTPVITSKTDIWAIWVKPSIKLGSYIRCDSVGVNNSKGEYYRLGNTAILGFPGASGKNPIRTIELEIIKGTGTIAVSDPNNNYFIQGNNTAKVIIVLPKGASMSEAENFIKYKIVIKPDTAQNPHAINVRVFGVTV